MSREKKFRRPAEKPNFGPCCCCGTMENVRTVVLLPFKCREPGTGWGCLICALEPDGAFAVLCDDCWDLARRPRMMVRGWLSSGIRDAIPKSPVLHAHIDSLHKACEDLAQFMPML